MTETNTNITTHGNTTSYRKGCRCDLCKSASQAYHQELKQRKELDGPFQRKNAAQHGTRSMYIYHRCRCDLCKNASNVYARKATKRTIWRSRTYLTRYGITLEEYEAMWNKQNGACAICEAPEGDRKLDIDHNHITGAIRGLLCSSCNMGIGLLHADEGEKLLTKALTYIN